MFNIGLVGILIVLGQILVGVVGGSAALWVQRRYFLFEEEDQSFAIPTTVAVFGCLAYFWVVISGGFQ